MGDDTFDSDMAALRKEFQDVTVERMADLGRAMESLAAAPSPAVRLTVLGELESIAHKLGGSGALFGFPELGDAAQAFELACQTAQSGAAGDDGAVRRAWTALEQAAGLEKGGP